LRRREFRRSPDCSTSAAGGGDACDSVFDDGGPLQIGEGAEDAKDSLAERRRGVEAFGEGDQLRARCVEVLRDIDQMIEVASKAAEPPDHHGVAGPKLGDELIEAGPFPTLATDHVLQDADASGALQRIDLEIEVLFVC
jgi:hypothetical protein